MWWRHRKTECPGPSPEHAEAQKALHKARKNLKRTQSSNTEIIQTAEKAKDYGRRNNFTEMIREALHGAGN